MTRLGAVLIVAVGAGLALPATALPIDHAVLQITPTKLAKTGPLKAWTLEGATVDSSYDASPAPRELLGVTLQRRLLSGRAEEKHAFRAAPVHSLTFDGASGRWDARFGNMLTVRMTIRTTGLPQPVDESLGCLGAFVRVPVVLGGTFTLPTRTKAFKTVRRTRLAATVTYNSGGPVSCVAGRLVPRHAADAVQPPRWNPSRLDCSRAGEAADPGQRRVHCNRDVNRATWRMPRDDGDREVRRRLPHALRRLGRTDVQLAHLCDVQRVPLVELA